MKILIVNRNYFIVGGPDKYMFEIQKYMDDCEFVPFCYNFEKNVPTPYSKFFVNPPHGGVFFRDFQMTLFQKVKFAAQSIYSFDAKKRLEALIGATKPDVAYFLYSINFSSSIIDACRKFNVPIIWRLSDFQLVCSSYHLMRDGKICEACLAKGLSQAIRYRCGGNQRLLGAACVKVMGMWLARFRKTYGYVDYFVTPSKLTRTKMIDGGFKAEKIIHIPTFVECDNFIKAPLAKKTDILYVGRLSREKGVNTLLRAFGRLENKDVTLTIVGAVDSPYAQSLMDSIKQEHKTRVQFLGYKSQHDINHLFEKCSFFVVPSIWYENVPNALLEGMSHGRAPIVSRLGSLLETVHDGRTGLHFEAGNAVDLAEKMTYLIENPSESAQLGLRAHKYVILNHAPRAHADRLRELFLNAL